MILPQGKAFNVLKQRLKFVKSDKSDGLFASAVEVKK